MSEPQARTVRACGWCVCKRPPRTVWLGEALSSDGEGVQVTFFRRHSHARLARPLESPPRTPVCSRKCPRPLSLSLSLSGTFSPKTDIFKAFLTALMATCGQKACSCMTKAASAPEFVLAGGRNRQFCGGCGDQRCWVLATLLDLRRSTVACSTSAAWPLPASVERSRRPARRVRRSAAGCGRVRRCAAGCGRVRAAPHPAHCS